MSDNCIRIYKKIINKKKQSLDLIYTIRLTGASLP